jgi:L-ascorbate metabolism protein UlaG (beta-lactamase superfamily)
MTDIRFLGHSCFELSDGEATVLIDPFLKPNNPQGAVTADEVDPDAILITHGHVDHLADAVGIAQRTDATCAAIVELAEWLKEQGVDAGNVLDPNLGGTVDFPWGWAKLVQAFHTSTTPGSEEAPFSPTPGTVIGHAGGWVVNLGDTTVYHLGDTALFGDLALIARSTPVDVALIPVGGHYTMDRHDAVIAAELIGADTVIPMHHTTFPPIETDLDAFKEAVESETKSKVVLLEPGETHST